VIAAGRSSPLIEKGLTIVPRHSHFLVFLLFGLTGQAAVHPHIFVDGEVGFEIDAARLSAFRIGWIYDEFTTLSFSTLWASIPRGMAR